MVTRLLHYSPIGFGWDRFILRRVHHVHRCVHAQTCYLERNPKCDRSKAFMVASCVSSRYLEAMAAHEGFLFQVILCRCGPLF